MVSDAILRRYLQNQFTDDDIARCIGFSARAYRELIKRKAVRTVTERRGPGRVRICDRTNLKRIAVIAALNSAGQSLAVAGQVAFFTPLHTLLFEICDPAAILCRGLADIDPNSELPPRVKDPRFDWFDPDALAKAEPDSDWLIDIFDNRFVGIRYTAADESTIFGDLRDDGAQFVAWYPHRERACPSGSIIELAQELNPRAVEAGAAWHNPTRFARELKSIGYAFERHNHDGDPLCVAVETAMRSPLVKTTVNISLAVRKALRRYLGLDPALADIRDGAESDL
jgi:hypothetical protein